MPAEVRKLLYCSDLSENSNVALGTDQISTCFIYTLF